MKKVRVRMNKALAVMLSALMACPSVSMGSVLADAANPSESMGSVLDGSDAGAPTAESGTDVSANDANAGSPIDQTQSDNSADISDPADGNGMGTSEDNAGGGAPVDGTNVEVPVDGASAEVPVDRTELDASTDGTDAGTSVELPAQDTSVDNADGNMPTEGTNAGIIADNTDAEQSVFSERAEGAYIFSYEGETAASSPFDGINQTETPQFNKNNALAMAASSSVKIPFTGKIEQGTAVFDVELCPVSGTVQNVVLQNSAGETLFVVCANANKKKIYLTSTEGGDELVPLGAYNTDNRWHRVRIELYFDESKDNVLKFEVSASCFGTKNGYSKEPDAWTVIGSVTQEDLLKVSGGENGTVSTADGSTEHPFDLNAITISNSGKARWIGDMYLYDITNVELAEQPGEQTPGEDFAPGEAAVKVTYSTGTEETIALKNLLCGVDYTVEENDTGKYVICYGGKKLETETEVPAAIMTGIRIKTQPTKKVYAKGETLDVEGLVVESVMSDGTAADLNADAYTLSTPDMSTEGLKEVIVTYNDNTAFTDSFKVRVESSDAAKIFAYAGDAVSVEELGLTGDTDKIQLSTEELAGSIGQNLAFNAGGTVTKSWDALNAGKVKVNVEFNQANKNNIAHFRLYDGAGNLLINFIQQKSGNLNLYKNTDTADSYETVVPTQIGAWVRLETEIDLTASNAEQKLIFTTKSYYKDLDTGEWKEGAVVSNQTYEGWGAASGCASDLTEFSLGSLAIQSTGAGVAYSKIEVLAPADDSQSFVYIDADDISDLELEESSEGVLKVHNGDQSGNTTNKLSITGGYITKTLKNPISSGKVSLETVGNHNGNIMGVQILDSEGRNLITYSQQSSGNLNLYYGTDITGTSNAGTIAGKDIISTKKWVKVKTEIDLDEANKTGVLEFTMNVQYKDSYLDEEWKDAGNCTQQLYLDKGLANGAAGDGFTSFDIGAIKIGNTGSTVYVDDIKFDDGNGINGYVTITDKILKSMEITTPAAVTEFPQNGKISTEGLVLTGTYDVHYSDGKVEEKTYKITKYEVECDTSQIVDAAPVTIKVTDHDKEFTASYNVKITPAPDGSYVTFGYTDESSVAQTGFSGSKISAAGGDAYGNDSNKIKLDKGSSTMTLAAPSTTGTVHFETEFLTTATSKASLFLRILNSEGKPMVDFAQYGSGNLNLYIDKKTSGTDGAMAGQFPGLPVKKWAKLSVDIDLDESAKQGHLVFDAVVWKIDDYKSGEWVVHAEFDEDLYLKSTMAPTTTGSASSDATVFDVASIELVNSNGTNYYDNMFFEAIRGDVTKELVELWIEKPAEKTDYTVGDGLNRTGLVLMGKYKYLFPNGDVKEKTAEVTKYDVSFDNTQPGDEVPVILSAGGLTASYNVVVRPNTALDDIEEYLVNYINNKLVNLDVDKVVHINKRQVRLPIETANNEGLSWEITSGNANVAENILTVIPSAEGETEVEVKVTLSTINNDGDPVSFSKTIKLAVPKESGKVVDDSLTTEESLRYAVQTLYERGLFDGQANLTDVEAVMASLGREITTEEIAVMLVNMFDIDTTFTDTKIDRVDVEDDAWYSKYVKAAFQLSVETRNSHEGKEYYGIGKGVNRDNLSYMINRIVHIDQTSLPSDYADRMFE